MRPLVLLESAAGTPVERLLDALGVVFERRSLLEALDDTANSRVARPTLILSEEYLSRVGAVGKTPTALLRELLSRYRHIMIYPFQGTPEGLQALSACVEGRVEAAPVNGGNAAYAVASGFPACGPFAGLKLSITGHTTDRRLSVHGSPHPVQDVVSVGRGALLARIVLPTGELFVAASTAVFDVHAELVKNLAVEECFSALVPLLIFLRHSGAAFWRTAIPTANVIIDDVNLRPRYGFVDARTLAQFVDRLQCAVSIGFIPWNWNRTSAEVVELFRSRWPRLSLCIHGCDHVGAEFSTGSCSACLPLIAVSLDRMRGMAGRTGVGYDRVMVFPQGRFSGSAMEALRQGDFLAAVNTELVDDRAQRGVRAGELLKPAITSYAGFPLFLRRKPDCHIANFALDLLLGKPCLVVTHHDDFRRGMQPVASLVSALNALAPALRWTTLETIVSGTYSRRPSTDGTLGIRLVTARTELVIPGAERGQAIHFAKSEPLAEKDFEISVDGQQVKAHREGGEILFSAAAAAAGPTIVDVRVSRPEPTPMIVRSLGYRAKVAARRYLSEFRDNYVARSPWATAAVRRIRGSRLAGADR